MSDDREHYVTTITHIPNDGVSTISCRCGWLEWVATSGYSIAAAWNEHLVGVADE